MASGGSARPAPAKKFPVQLAQGVLQDLLAKELDAHFSPDDGTKQAAFAASREALPRRFALLSSQIGAADRTAVGEGLCSLVVQLWKFIRSHPLLERIEPSFLDSSLWLETLSSIFTEACAAAGPHISQLVEGGVLVTAAVLGVGTGHEPFSAVPPDTISQLIKLVRWWGDDICGKRWSVERPWDEYIEVDVRRGLLHTIAECGLAAFVPLAVEKGCPVNGDVNGASSGSPAILALKTGHIDVVEALLTHGLDLFRPYEKEGWALALAFFSQGRGKGTFLADLLRRCPDIVRVRSSDRARRSFNLLDAAIMSEDPAIVDLALSAGAKPQFSFEIAGDDGILHPSLTTALLIGNAPVLKALVTKGQVLEGWKDKYDSQALGDILSSLVRLAISAYPSNPHFKGDPKHLVTHNPQAMECLELVLASGIECPRHIEWQNALLSKLYVREPTVQCVLEEKHALVVLRRFHSAGFNVLGKYANDLPRLATKASQPCVLDYCLGELGASPHDDVDPALGEKLGTLLAWAFYSRCIPCVTLLLEKYKVRAAYPEKPLADQPVVAGFLSRIPEYNDSEAERVLRALVERDPELFAIPCFSEASIAERNARRRSTMGSPAELEPVDFWNPVFMLTLFDKRQALEFLLKSDIPGVAAMANRAQLTPTGSLTPAQAAVLKDHWDCLGLILRYTGAKVTETFDDQCPPAAEILRRIAARGGSVPRTVVAMVEARAKEELAEKATTAAASQAAGASTNAFEDPSVKPLTEQEEKAKAKKKAAKKKAKAKRHAAARAGAGATDVHDSSSDEDDDDDGPHEDEPDDNLVDSSNAPSLDLMLEQMGLKEKK